MKALERVLDSDSYCITNHVRIKAFKTLERPNLKKLATQHRVDLKFFEKTQIHLARTTPMLRHNIEIQEEGHSKAILAFTIVTIIFLPLSSVASLFGMNTTDIRDIEKDQTIF